LDATERRSVVVHSLSLSSLVTLGTATGLPVFAFWCASCTCPGVRAIEAMMSRCPRQCSTANGLLRVAAYGAPVALSQAQSPVDFEIRDEVLDASKADRPITIFTVVLCIQAAQCLQHMLRCAAVPGDRTMSRFCFTRLICTACQSCCGSHSGDLKP
jgi:hypothetical protein